jgi:hypothetical protein
VNETFWRKPDKWPRDAPGYIFLARAFDKIGRAIFPDDWVDATEYGVVHNYTRLPRSSESANTQQRLSVHRRLQSEHPNFRRPPLELLHAGSSTFAVVPPFSKKEWGTAYDANQALHQKSERVKEQYLKVQFVIAEQCEASHLVVATRSNKDGKMNPWSSTIWNTEAENWSQRFDKCQFDPFSPMENRGVSQKLEWIFLSTDSLEKVLHKLLSHRPAVQVKQKVSAESQCRAWLIQEMEKYASPPKPKDAYREEATQKFGIGHRPFDRAWTAAMTTTNRHNWSNPGRKPKSTH